MADTTVNGVKINYRQVGAGPDLVLVHGLAANQAFWNLQMVAELAREYRVTTFDLRGHGYSGTLPDGYQPANIATDLYGLLDHLDIQKAHLVGHSFGGLVIIHAALVAPNRYLSLTIADTRIRSLQPKQGVTQTPGWPAMQAKLAEHGIVLDEAELDHSLVLFEAFAALGWDAHARGPTDAAAPPLPGSSSRSARRWLQLLANSTLRSDFQQAGDVTPAQLSQLHRPVLAVYGDQSPARRTGEHLAAHVPYCQTVLVPEARHFHPSTHPQFFRATLLKFLHELKLCA